MSKSKQPRRPPTARPPAGPLVANRRRAVPRLTELRRVATEALPAILAAGHRFNMHACLRPLSDGGSIVQALRLECETVGCLGGWGDALSAKLRRLDSTWREVYGLTLIGTNYLFYCFDWPNRGPSGLAHAVRRLDIVLAEARGEARP